jgi:alkanesulfonate monooxygenase SsuD/methylene tetrahydromethanopterin reductase-like flavin-dependent oxidoreductase (luciferase family)
MRVEFIGIARTADRSETITEAGPAVQPDYLHHLVAAHEHSGFDQVPVAHSSSSPDGFIVAEQVLSATTRLGVLLAHRPRAAAHAAGRAVDRFSVSLRPIAADTEAAARERAHQILAQATGAAGDSTALVGSYEQVAESLLGYVAAGATTLLIRGYDPLPDAAAYADLIRLVHDQVGDDVDSYRARVAA